VGNIYAAASGIGIADGYGDGDGDGDGDGHPHHHYDPPYIAVVRRAVLQSSLNDETFENKRTEGLRG